MYFVFGSKDKPPLAKLVKWLESEGVFDRVHVDFLAPVNNRIMFLVNRFIF